MSYWVIDVEAFGKVDSENIFCYTTYEPNVKDRTRLDAIVELLKNYENKKV